MNIEELIIFPESDLRNKLVEWINFKDDAVMRIGTVHFELRIVQ